MYDPWTVAFSLYPFLTIWHKDPEKDGTDDSCDWFDCKPKLTVLEKAIQAEMWNVETILDNPPHYPDSREHLTWQPLNTAIHE